MNPLDKIKEGIEKQDWGLVCEGYNTMTGQKLLIPTQPIKSELEVFKSYIQRSINDFKVPPTSIDEPDTKDYVVETCGVSPASSNDDAEQSTDDDEKNVDFDEVTSGGKNVGLYGNKTVLITEKPQQSQIKVNKKLVEGRGEHNIPRPPPRTYSIKCTDCQNPFESRMQTGEFGQKCPKCLRSMSRER